MTAARRRACHGKGTDTLLFELRTHRENGAGRVPGRARSAGAEVHIKRVPELVPHKVALSANYKLEQVAPVAQIDDLVDYDAVIFGTPTDSATWRRK